MTLCTGLPRLRARLPSRNWTIFLTVVGSFSGTIIYDRWHKRHVQQRWCNAVSHLSREPLQPDQLPRKLTIYLAAPPGDGLSPTREFFVEYVKPILVAAAVDWEVVEGRKEGDVRAELARKLREKRRESGEKAERASKEESSNVVANLRQNLGIQAADGRGGDLVLGRHTWKEYVRGLHEGWLGPINDPKEKEPPPEPSGTLLDSSFPSPGESMDGTDKSSEQAGSHDTLDDPSQRGGKQDSDGDKAVAAKQETKPESKPSHLPPYIRPVSYPDAILAPSTPATFACSTAVGQPHILGFFNTPVRIYRFLTRRRLADSTARQVAELLLAEDARPYRSPLTDSFSSELSSTNRDQSAQSMWEVQSLLQREEDDWHKVARAPNKEGEEDRERPWKEDMVLDARIVERMRTPDTTTATTRELDPTAEQRWEGVSEEDEKVTSRYRDWKGGADPVLRHISWRQWLKEASGFDDRKEPRGLYAKDGLVDEE